MWVAAHCIDLGRVSTECEKPRNKEITVDPTSCHHHHHLLHHHRHHYCNADQKIWASSLSPWVFPGGPKTVEGC